MTLPMVWLLRSGLVIKTKLSPLRKESELGNVRSMVVRQTMKLHLVDTKNLEMAENLVSLDYTNTASSKRFNCR